MNTRIIHTSPTGYTIIHYTKIVEAGTALPHNKELLGLTFILDNELAYAVDTIPPGKISQNHYNFYHLPTHHPCELTIKNKGQFSTLTIQCTKNYLQNFIEEFPRVKKLTEVSIYPLLYSAGHLPITEEMMTRIKTILNNKHTGILREEYFTEITKELIIQCLRHINNLSRFLTAAHPQVDIDSIEQAHNYLINNLDLPCSVNVLTSMFNIERRRLERGFKLCYGETVYAFHLNERMKKARLLLCDPTISVKEAAKKIGYKRVTSFSQVFKAKFGYTPRKVRINNPVDTQGKRKRI